MAGLYGPSQYGLAAWDNKPPAQPTGGSGLFGIHLPKLGLADLVAQLGGAATGIARLGYDPINVIGNAIIHGPGSPDASDAASQMRKDYVGGVAGLESGIGGTAADALDLATAGKAHGISDTFRKGVGALANADYSLAGTPVDHRPDLTPQSLGKQVKAHGLLAPLAADVGNVALGADAAGGLLKLSDLGKVAEASRAADVAGEAGSTANDLRTAARAAQKAQTIDATKFAPEDIAARASALDKLHTAGHPYSALFRGAVRPLTQAAQEAVLDRAAAAGAAEPAVNAVDVARAHLAEPTADVAPTVAAAPTVSPEIAQAAEEASASVKAPPTADLATPPADGTTRLYRGEQVGNQGGSEFTPNLAEAQGHAGPDGHLLTVDVPNEVAAAGAEAARAQGGVGVTLPDEFVTAAQPVAPEMLRPATEIAPERLSAAAPPIAAQAATTAPAVSDAAQGAPAASPSIAGLEPVAPRQGPHELASRLQAGATPPDWARTVVSKLPQPVVDRMAAIEAHLEKSATRRVVAEQRRVFEAARRNAADDPAVVASMDAAKQLLGKTTEDGAHITPEMADKMLGGAVTKILDGTHLIEKLGVPEDVVNAIIGVELPIPEALRTPELMDAVGRAADAWRDAEQQRLNVMAGSRLGMKGLGDIGSDTPTLSRSEQALWKQIVKEVRRIRSMDEGAIPRERARFEKVIAESEGKAAKIGSEVERMRAQQAALRGRLLPLVGRDPGEGQVGTFRAPINDAGNGPVPFARLSVPELGARLQNVDQLRDEQGLPPETPAEARQRGYRAGKIVEQHQALEQQIADRVQRQARVRSAADAMRQTMLDHTTPSELLRGKLEGHVQRSIDRLAVRVDNPSVARTPGQWKPLWGAVKQIEAMAKDNPELAEMFAGVPTHFNDVLRAAAERGIEPTFISSLSDNQVRQLVYENMKLGASGREGVEVTSGARKARVGAFARERTISALVAAQHAATHEATSNAVIDYVEHTWAKPVEGGIIPKGFVPWDGVRSYIRTGEKVDAGTRALQPTMMIPKAVANALKDSGRDFSHGSFTTIQKIQKPWQALMLSYNPAFQVHHFAVKVALATAEGARFQDFADAWRNWRADTGKYREAAQTVNFYGEREPSIFPKVSVADQIAQAREAGGTGAKPVYEAALRAISKPLDVVDKLTRSAVYSSELRRGGTSEMALNRAAEALGDYQSLSAFEQQVVRAVMPFYPFQKSIVSMMLKWPIENPKVVAISAALANMNTQAASDAAGSPQGTQVPQGYQDLFKSPVGVLNLHSLDPFAKVEQLVTPQGIAAAVNPFLSIAVKNAYGVSNSDHLKRMDAYGHLVDDTSPASDVTKLLAGSPQAKLAEGLLGTGIPGQAAPTGGAPQAAAQFGGVPVYTQADVQKIIDRVTKTQNTLAGASTASTSSSSSSGSKIGAGLSKAVTGGSHRASSHRSTKRRSTTGRIAGTGATRGKRFNIKHVAGTSKARGFKTGAARVHVKLPGPVSSFGGGRGYASSVVGARFKSSSGRAYGSSTKGDRFNASRRSH